MCMHRLVIMLGKQVDLNQILYGQAQLLLVAQNNKLKRQDYKSPRSACMAAAQGQR